jgi:hypothetical protein
LGKCFEDESLNGEMLYAFVKISSGKGGQITLLPGSLKLNTMG